MWSSDGYVGTQDLGKAVGMRTVVFNCGQHIDRRFMARFFAGLAQCGAWACFDEFNRIHIEVRYHFSLAFHLSGSSCCGL